MTSLGYCDIIIVQLLIAEVNGVNISLARGKRGMTQSELACRLCVTQGAVSQWETGKAIPRPEMLVKIADILGCTVDELLRRKEE